MNEAESRGVDLQCLAKANRGLEPPEESPAEDFVAAATPDVAAYARLRLLRISAYAGSDLTYYQENVSERSVGYVYRGRFDFLLSRMRPFIGGLRPASHGASHHVRSSILREVAPSSMATGIGTDQPASARCRSTRCSRSVCSGRVSTCVRFRT